MFEPFRVFYTVTVSAILYPKLPPPPPPPPPVVGMRLLCLFLPIMLFPNAPYYVRLCSSIFRLCSSMFQLCPSTKIGMVQKILEAQFLYAGLHASQKIFRVETYNSFGKS